MLRPIGIWSLAVTVGVLGAAPSTATEKTERATKEAISTPQISIVYPKENRRYPGPTLEVVVGWHGHGTALRSLDLFLAEDRVTDAVWPREAAQEDSNLPGRPASEVGSRSFELDLGAHPTGWVLLRVEAVFDDGSEVEDQIRIRLRQTPITKGTDPDGDEDYDGLTYFEETMIYLTDPSLPDSDGDAFWDGVEVEEGGDPLDALMLPSMTLATRAGDSVLRHEIQEDPPPFHFVAGRPTASVLRSGPLVFEPAMIGWTVSRPPAPLIRVEPFDPSTLTLGPVIGRPPVTVEYADSFVFLLAHERVPVASDAVATVPLEIRTEGDIPVASAAFSIDYDDACLAFDPADGDGDGQPDALSFDLPAGWTGSVLTDLADPDGEIDVFLFSNPPSALPDGVFASVDLQPICVPAWDQRLQAAVAFSFDPKATFGDVEGRDLAGATTPGSVEILGGLRGDCNSSGQVNAGDFPALVLELFDDDGDGWLAVPQGTFPGHPVGCDANADKTVAVADLGCIGRLIFDRACTSPDGPDSESSTDEPHLILDPPRSLPSGDATIDLRLVDGAEVGSVAFSLEIDPGPDFRLDPRDDDGDGLPDAVVVHSHAGFRFLELNDQGRLNVVLADLSQAPQPLGSGPLLTLELTSVTPEVGQLPCPTARFADQPAPSFGDLFGGSLAGFGTAPSCGLFADDFESGDLSAWSSPP